MRHILLCFSVELPLRHSCFCSYLHQVIHILCSLLFYRHNFPLFSIHGFLFTISNICHKKKKKKRKKKRVPGQHSSTAGTFTYLALEHHSVTAHGRSAASVTAHSRSAAFSLSLMHVFGHCPGQFSRLFSRAFIRSLPMAGQPPSLSCTHSVTVHDSSAASSPVHSFGHCPWQFSRPLSCTYSVTVHDSSAAS